jgi:hypothetical protein
MTRRQRTSQKIFFFEPKSTDFILLHQNVQGLLNKLEDIELCIDEMADRNNSIQVLCFTETFIKQGSESNIRIKGFNLAATFSRKNIKRGGSCILVRQHYQYRSLVLCKTLSVEKVFECCGIEIPNLKCILICIYRVPEAKNVRLFLDKLNVLLSKITTNSTKKIIITGDLNINTMKTDSVTRELKSLMLNYNCLLHINVPTRGNSCIDHIVSNIKHAVGKVHTLHLSDHETCQTLEFPVSDQIKLNTQYWYIRKKSYSQENVYTFLKHISSLTWDDCYNEPDSDVAFSKFHDMFHLIYNLCFPEQRIKITSNNCKPKWITKGIKKACYDKRYLRFLYYKNRTQEHKDMFKKKSKLLRLCINQSQRNLNRKFMLNSKNKSRATWSIIKDQTDVVSSFESIDSINFKGQTITDPLDIANLFNDHFINTHKKICNWKSTIKNVDFVNSSIFISPCTVSEIVKCIESLNNTKAVGFDGVSTHIIKKCSRAIAPILTHLINESFSQGKFPTKLKYSIVKPLFKKDDKQALGNYRPITLISIFAKIYEKAMHSRMSQFIEKYNIIAKEQNGFQKGKSITNACYSLLESITHKIDQKTPLTGIFFDMSKAFDCVNHDTLLAKCDRYGFRGLALEWLKSYLVDRRQCVEVRRMNERSEIVAFHSSEKYNGTGVPQGSILGPLLFIVYINDLPKISQYKTVLFADDISVLIPDDHKDRNIYVNNINMAVESICNWLEENNLFINASKTKYVQFCTTKANIPKLSITCKGHTIEENSETKFLGLIIDRHCSWKSHIDNVCCKLERFSYALKRLKRLSDQKTALIAYHGYVASLLRFGLIIWGNASEIQRVFISQKKCVRAICGVGPLDSCRPLFKKLNLLTLTSMYILEISVYVKSNYSLFTSIVTNPRLRSRDPMRLIGPRSKTALFRNNCYLMSIKIFNHLPLHIKEIPNVMRFRRALYSWLVENTFYNIKDYFEFVSNKLN